MALSAVFSADFEKFERAVKGAVVELTVLDRAAKNATRDLKRELEGISGQKLVKEASLMAEAVKRLGGEGGAAAGVLKLLPDELHRVSTALERAAQKAALLGEELPASLREVQEAIEALPKPSGDVAKGLGDIDKASVSASLSFGKFVAGFVTAEAFMGVARATFRAYVDLIRSSVESFANAEAAQAKLTAALRAQGTATPATIDQYSELAAQFQRTTVFADDLLMEMQGLLVQVGDVMPSEMEGALQAATNLAAGLGIDLRQATMLVAKAFEGNTGALSRYGIVVDEGRLKTEGMSAVLDEINQKFGGQAQAQIGTYAGQVAQLGNAWDDLKERFGEFIARSDEVQAVLFLVTSSLQDTTAEGSENAKATAGMIEQWDAFADSAVLEWIPGIGSLKRAIRELSEEAERQRMARAIPEPSPTPFGPVGDRRDPGGLALVEQSAAMRDYVAELANMERQLKALDPEQRKQLDAALKTVGATKELATAFGLTEKELRLYTSAAKDGATATADLFSAGVIKRASDFSRELGDVGNVSKLTADKKRELRTAVEQALVAYHALGREAPEKLRQIVTATTDLLTVTRSFADAGRGMFVPFKASVEDAGQALQNIAAGLEANGNLISRTIPEAADAAREADKAFREWAAANGVLIPTIQQVSAEASEVSTTLRGQLSEILQSVPETIAKALVFSGDIENAAKALASEIGATIGKHIGKSIGWKLGESIGGAVGALAGLLVDVIGKIGPDPASDVLRRVGRDWGTQISRGLAEQIAADAESLFRGNRQIAEVFNFGDILDEAGGLSTANVERFLARFRDVFVFFAEGRLSLQQTQRLLNENFAAFADHVLKTGEIASREFLEILRLNQEMGIESEAIADFIESQASRAGQALADLFAGANTQEEFDRLGVVALGAFNAAIEGGLSMQEALAALKPGLEELTRMMAEFGFTAEDAALKALVVASEVADTTAGKAAAALNEAILALSNFGALNDQTLDSLEAQLTTVYARIQAEVSALGGDTTDALRQVVPFLQQIIKASEEFGLTIDPATQMLIDQARELGILGDAGQTETDVMKEGFESVVNAVHELTDAILGIPAAARAAANALNEIKLPPIDRRRDGGDEPVQWTPGDRGGGSGPMSITAARLGGRVSSFVNAGGASHALMLLPVFVHGQASASEIDRAIASQLPVALATGQPRAAVTTLATLAAEEAIARAR